MAPTHPGGEEHRGAVPLIVSSAVKLAAGPVVTRKADIRTTAAVTPGTREPQSEPSWVASLRPCGSQSEGKKTLATQSLRRRQGSGQYLPPPAIRDGHSAGRARSPRVCARGMVCRAMGIRATAAVVCTLRGHPSLIRSTASAQEGRPASTSARRDHARRGTPIDARSPGPFRDAQAASCGRGPATKRAVTRKQASGRREGAVVDLPHPPILGIESQAVRGRRTRAEV